MALEKTLVSRLRKIWDSLLTGKIKANLTNSWAVSIYRYYFACLKWTRKEVQQLDMLTRTILRQRKSHHANASIERLYLPRTKGGRGLISLESCWERVVVSTATYVANGEMTLTASTYGEVRTFLRAGRDGH